MFVTAPEGKITGYFSVKDVVEAKPSELWEQYREVSGTTKDFFFDYYGNQDTGLGLLVDQVEILQNPITLPGSRWEPTATIFCICRFRSLEEAEKKEEANRILMPGQGNG